MKKYYFLIILTLILGLVLTGCLLSNVGQVPTTEQSGISTITKSNGIVTIVIDGIFDSGEWDSYLWFIDNSAGPGTGYDDDPLPVFTGYLHFDDTNLYLAFDVQDNTPDTNRDFLYVTIDIPTAGVFDSPVDALYWGSVPANPSSFGEAYLTVDPFPWDRSQRASTWGTDGGVVTARTITATNRYYELMIPLTAIGASLGDTIGLKIQARGGQYRSETDPQVVNYFPDMPGGITPIRADTRVEFPDNFYQFTLTPPPIEVPVDIKPQSCPNPLNTKSKGVTPVAILGTADFDVTDIDPLTIILAGVSPISLSWNLEDVATPFEPYTGKDNCDFHCNTLGPDGFLDLTLKFDTPGLLEAVRVINAMGIIENFEISEEDIIAFENGEEELVTTDGIPLEDGVCLTVTLNGTLYNGLSIVGEDVVRILQKGNNK